MINQYFIAIKNLDILVNYNVLIFHQITIENVYTACENAGVDGKVTLEDGAGSTAQVIINCYHCILLLNNKIPPLY